MLECRRLCLESSADDTISGSQLVQKSTIAGQTVSWEVPCNTAVQFTVNIGSQQFTVDQSLLVQKQSDGTCISIIEGFIDGSVTQYIFGQTWISQLYVCVSPFSLLTLVAFVCSVECGVGDVLTRQIGRAHV